MNDTLTAAETTSDKRSSSSMFVSLIDSSFNNNNNNNNNMSHFLALHFSLARRLIGPGQTDVLSLLGRLAD